MGVHPARSPEEEDIAHEEAAPTNGWQGAQGRDGVEQVPGLREHQKGSLALSTLRCQYVCERGRGAKLTSAGIHRWFGGQASPGGGPSASTP